MVLSASYLICSAAFRLTLQGLLQHQSDHLHNIRSLDFIIPCDNMSLCDTANWAQNAEFRVVDPTALVAVASLLRPALQQPLQVLVFEILSCTRPRVACCDILSATKDIPSPNLAAYSINLSMYGTCLCNCCKQS